MSLGRHVLDKEGPRRALPRTRKSPSGHDDAKSAWTRFENEGWGDLQMFPFSSYLPFLSHVRRGVLVEPEGDRHEPFRALAIASQSPSFANDDKKQGHTRIELLDTGRGARVDPSCSRSVRLAGCSSGCALAS